MRYRRPELGMRLLLVATFMLLVWGLADAVAGVPLALAAGTSSLSIRQNSLQFVSIMIRNLGSYCKGLEMDGMREREYLELLRQELSSFRKSFKQWRKSLGN